MQIAEINQKIRDIKKTTHDEELSEAHANHDPFQQFIAWFSDALESSIQDPTAMVLSTIDENNLPDARVVLLKELVAEQFIFYSSYQSKKARDLLYCPFAVINFYWPALSRQIRIRGRVDKTSRAQSEAYFKSRPRETQITTHAWVQSTPLDNREEMNKKIHALAEKYANTPIPCPETWGGYVFTPFEYEFFQGRQWRMHDRLLYQLQDRKWQMSRLAP